MKRLLQTAAVTLLAFAACGGTAHAQDNTYTFNTTTNAGTAGSYNVVLEEWGLASFRLKLVKANAVPGPPALPTSSVHRVTVTFYGDYNAPVLGPKVKVNKAATLATGLASGTNAGRSNWGTGATSGQFSWAFQSPTDANDDWLFPIDADGSPDWGMNSGGRIVTQGGVKSVGVFLQNDGQYSGYVNVAPEPGSLALLGAGVLPFGLAFLRRRKRAGSPDESPNPTG